MLSLDKLSIKGFKSFVEPTEFEIKTGLTGIVGPNGCGKSNIVEAIRFGLGEVSAKQLRGKEIDDLIFNGTDNRPSWNLAEVGLFVNIDGSDLENKFESKSLEIARKIWRGEGTNSYINGKEVRLKDIQLLFADASTSARSTSIVSQGRIGAITQAKPEDRKMVLEEAAGILGLQSRRHDSELRLKAATNNLLRVEDVIKTYELMAKRLGMNDTIRGKIANWHSSKERYSKSKEIFAQFEDKTNGLKNIAQIWMMQKQPKQAVQIYDRLMKTAPDNITNWKIAIAEIYSSTKDYEKAIDVYRELISLAPAKASDWYWSIGGIYEKTKMLKLAIQSYRNSDNYPQAYFQMAKCHRKLEEYNEALILYKQALATESAASDATIAIGYTYEEQSNKNNAIKWFQRTCKLFPRSRNASKAHSHLQKEYGISVTLGGSKEK